jgi:RNA polymerase sigma factor (TIGR02999 family)
MRSVIVNCANERLSQKRGGEVQCLTLSTELAAGIGNDEESVIKVHEALAVLEQVDPRGAQVVEMRYFGGYSEEEIAEALGVTERTVRRDWDKARALLLAALG